MTTTTKYFYTSFKTFEEVRCGERRVDYATGMYITGVKEEFYTPTISRAKPENLLLSPTSCGPHTRSERHHGFRSKEATTEDATFCSHYDWQHGIGSPVYQYFAHSYWRYMTVSRPGLTTNWQLPLRDKLKSHTYSLSSAIAEFDETCDLFSDAARAIFKAYKALKRYAKFRKFNKINNDPKYLRIPKRERIRFHSGDVSAAVLVTNFGIAPTIGDFSESYIALQRRLLRDVVKRVKSGGAAEVSVDETDDSGYSYNMKATRKDRAIIYARFDPDIPLQYGNPAEWIWERIPFSFIIDQMFNIGKTLSALDAFTGVASITGTLST